MISLLRLAMAAAPWRRGSRFSCAVVMLGWLALSGAGRVGAQTNEYRAYWVDAFGAGFRSAAEVTTLVSDLRAGKFNAVFAEVRKRGDAYYTPNTGYADYEPKATDMAAGFDSLADLVAKCHDTSGGKQRIEVHAWLVTFPIWNSSTAPASAQHPFNRHPEWLSSTDTGTQYDGNWYFDPGHPGVQRHTYATAMDILTRYDVDGINFDYVRYMGQEWGYNTNSVARFNARSGTGGVPAKTDASWKQFRRDQVTALVRKVWLNAYATKPNVKISADTITWAPGPTSVASWLSSSGAYTDVLQDWRGWMEEGILDLNVPMAYFDQAGSYTTSWTNWNHFTKDNQYQRHALIGPGTYLNTVTNAIRQMRFVRTVSPAGNAARGMCLYSYRVPYSTSLATVPRATFHAALTTNNVSALDAVSPGLFNLSATIPVMPWKTAPTNGHLKGFLSGTDTNNALDGATITATGPVNRTQRSDATGFYGFVELPPGVYALSASMAGQGAATGAVTIAAGVVSTVSLTLVTNDGKAPVINGLAVTNLSAYSAVIRWNTDEPADSVVEYGLGGFTQSVTNAALVAAHALNVGDLSASTPYVFRVRSRDVGGNAAVSAGSNSFTTLPAAAVADVIVDDAAATTVGSWTVSSASPGYVGTGYRFTGAGSGGAQVEFRPHLVESGRYRVYTWYVASAPGGNRTTNAQHVVSFDGGTQIVGVNQEANSTQWVLLGTFSFGAGTNGTVRITDVMPEPSGNVAVADAVRWEFVPPAALAPVILAQPGHVAVFAGQPAQFAVAATGSLPLSYQWRLQGTNLVGATGSAVLRPNAQPADAGLYSVMVINAGGSVTSSNALLTVTVPDPGWFSAFSFQPPSAYQLELNGTPGATYLIEISTNLLQWQWLKSITLTGPSGVVEDASAVGERRFYRARP